MEASGSTRETFASHPMSSGWIAPMHFPPEAYAPGNKFTGPGYGVPYMLLPGGIPPGQVFIGPAPGSYNLLPDQQPRPRMGNVFFKTRVCNKWRNGCCPYGDRCTYAHGEHELRTLPPELLAQLGALHIGGAAGPPPMSPMVPQSRAHVPLAPRVYATAGAPLGRSGTVYSAPPPLQAFMPVTHPHMVRHSPAASASDGAPVSPAAGPLSPRARNEAVGHPYYKTRLCIRYVQLGHCPRGAHCSYAHGYEELRARSSSSSGAPVPMHMGAQWAGQGPASCPGSGSPPSTTLSSSVAPSTERTLEVLPNTHLPPSPRAAPAEGNGSTLFPGSPTSKKQDADKVGERESSIDDRRDECASHEETEEEEDATGKKERAD